MGEIMVSIYCLTYNHAEYIQDTFEGFLRQKTDFKFNVFVYDDASTDGTSEIVREYKARYPDIFNIYISQENTWHSPQRNLLLNSLFQKYVNGKYVALCEGDDYWIDDNKLQMQVDYLERHSECVMTVHACKWLNCIKNEFYEHIPYNSDKMLSAEEIIMGHGMIPTASMVMRKNIFIQDEKYPVCGVGDYPLQLYAITKGKIFYFNQIMSVYRYMFNGSWSQSMNNNRKNKMIHCFDMVNFLDKYNRYTDYRYNDIVRKRQVGYLYCNVYNNIDITFDEYDKNCTELLDDVDDACKEYLKCQCKIFKIFNGIYVFSKDELKIIKQYKYVVIMGNGQYAGYLEKVMKKNNIEYDGHIVTKLKKEEENRHNLWELGNYPYDKNDTLVIIGINQQNEKDVMESLEMFGYNNALKPLWFTI